MSAWQRQSQQPQQQQKWTCLRCGSSNVWHQALCKGCQTLTPNKVLSVIRQAQMEYGPSPRKPGGGQRAQGGAGWGKGARKGEGSAGRRPVAAPQPGGGAKGFGKGPRPSNGKGKGNENRKGQSKGARARAEDKAKRSRVLHLRNLEKPLSPLSNPSRSQMNSKQHSCWLGHSQTKPESQPC